MNRDQLPGLNMNARRVNDTASGIDADIGPISIEEFEVGVGVADLNESAGAAGAVGAAVAGGDRFDRDIALAGELGRSDEGLNVVRDAGLAVGIAGGDSTATAAAGRSFRNAVARRRRDRAERDMIGAEQRLAVAARRAEIDEQALRAG